MLVHDNSLKIDRVKRLSFDTPNLEENHLELESSSY
jgi:hypothetical protein